MRVSSIVLPMCLSLAGSAGCGDDEAGVAAPTPAPVVCPSGRGDCDEDPANGCEADLTSSVDYCGRCSGNCRFGQRCVEGECRGPGAADTVCAGERHVCAIGDRLVHCWGRGNPAPRPIADSHEARALSCGRDRTCFVGTDHRVACWDGELREGAGATRVPGLTGVVRLAMGADTACALRGDGSVHCWTGAERPRTVSGLANVLDLSAAGDDACAVTVGGVVFCWTLDDASAPRRVTGVNAVAVVARDGGGCARDDTGAIHCWGDAGAGAIGDGTGEARPEPTRVAELEGASRLRRIGARTLCAFGHGDVRCWGDNRSGQLGGEDAEALAPVEPPAFAQRSLTPVSAGFGISCGEDLAGSVYCWGDNRHRVIDTDDEIVRAAWRIEGVPRAPRNPY